MPKYKLVPENAMTRELMDAFDGMSFPTKILAEKFRRDWQMRKRISLKVVEVKD